MSAIAAAVEETTELALHEKAKLQKSLGGFDMVFFTVCAPSSASTRSGSWRPPAPRASRG